jgi:hypothetical protein
MSTNKELAGVLFTAMAIGAGIGYGVDQHTQSVARGNAIAVDACIAAYNSGDGSIDEQTIDCISDGWDDSGLSINFGPIAKGSPVQLLSGYANEQRGIGNHFNGKDSVYWGIGLGAVSIYMFSYVSGQEDGNSSSHSPSPKPTPETEIIEDSSEITDEPDDQDNPPASNFW